MEMGETCRVDGDGRVDHARAAYVLSCPFRRAGFIELVRVAGCADRRSCVQCFVPPPTLEESSVHQPGKTLPLHMYV